jgi:hypothetical protein
MRKKLLTLLSSVVMLSAQDSDIKLHAQMINKLALDISKQEHPKIYDPTFGRSYSGYLNNSTTVNTCNEADIVIISSTNQMQGCNKNQIILVTKYDLLNEIPNAIGAFYWQKGRPNLVFISPRLVEKNMKLTSEYSNLTDNRIY